MKKLYTIDEIRETVRPITEKYDINKIWLFGSYARGEATTNSDIDLLIEYKQGLGLRFVGFVCDLEDELGVLVDVISVESLYHSPEHCLKKALIENVEKDRKLLIDNEVELNFYIDDTGIPYEEGESPRPRTKEDDDFDAALFEELGIITKDNEED